jgi:hypothetical protein
MVSRLVIGGSVEERMRSPVMSGRQAAARWKVSPKSLRRWRLDKEGPIWRKPLRVRCERPLSIPAFLPL